MANYIIQKKDQYPNASEEVFLVQAIYNIISKCEDCEEGWQIFISTLIQANCVEVLNQIDFQELDDILNYIGFWEFSDIARKYLWSVKMKNYEKANELRKAFLEYRSSDPSQCSIDFLRNEYQQYKKRALNLNCNFNDTMRYNIFSIKPVERWKHSDYNKFVNKSLDSWELNTEMPHDTLEKVAVLSELDVKDRILDLSYEIVGMDEKKAQKILSKLISGPISEEISEEFVYKTLEKAFLEVPERFKVVYEIAYPNIDEYTPYDEGIEVAEMCVKALHKIKDGFKHDFFYMGDEGIDKSKLKQLEKEPYKTIGLLSYFHDVVYFDVAKAKVYEKKYLKLAVMEWSKYKELAL